MAFGSHIMSEATSPSQHNKTQSAYNSCPVRRMRNTAVLVKWIEDHQSNPYPTKAEKQLLAYYSGMTLTQLSTWFANARRRIKKIGMKTWLEGRSTFSLDYFPSSANMSRSAMTSSYPGKACSLDKFAFLACLLVCLVSCLGLLFVCFLGAVRLLCMLIHPCTCACKSRILTRY